MSSTETLREKRCRFTRALSKLEAFVRASGMECCYEEVKRSDEQACINALGPMGRSRLCAHLDREPEFATLALAIRNNVGSGIRGSLHELGLAADVNLYRNGKWLSSTEDHRAVGEYWESLGPDHRWGGRFGDGNHYSIEHGGRK